MKEKGLDINSTVQVVDLLVSSLNRMARLDLIPRGSGKRDHWESVHKQAMNVSKINIVTTIIIKAFIKRQ